jgi:CHAT domain-containing protein
MISRPRIAPLLKSLAVSWLAASIFLYDPPPALAAASSSSPDVQAAVQLYFAGKAVTARRDLERFLERSPGLAPETRLGALGALLDVCIRLEAFDCLQRRAHDYVEAARAMPPMEPLRQRDLARLAGHYLDYAAFATGERKDLVAIVDGPLSKQESVLDPLLYLQRQGLQARALVALGRFGEASRSVDKTLSLVVALKDPHAGRAVVGVAVADAIAALLDAGDADRAYGVYRAAAPFLSASIAPATPEAVAFHLTEGRVLEQHGDFKAARAAYALAIATLGRIELEPALAERSLAAAETGLAVACAAEGEIACAEEALSGHPYAVQDESAARAPGRPGEIDYLLARALVGSATGRPDPVATGRLAGLAAVSGNRAEAYRAAGAALLLPEGRERRAALREAARAFQADARRPVEGGAFGAWRRPGGLDRILIRLALAGLDPADRTIDAAAFDLFQLDLRAVAPPDGDALTLLGEATGEMQRRSVHQALRLRARRDRLERAELAKLAGKAPGGSGHDTPLRLSFRDFSNRLEATRVELAGSSPAAGGQLASLSRFRAVLKPDEAALLLTPVSDGMAYMCVRRDAVVRAFRPADLGRARLDQRLVQQALTAVRAASETNDAQYPVEAAMRLYDLFVRPFESCLKPGDQILWVSGVAVTKVPLAALLRSAPPRAGEGWDLAKADWLARSHAVSYAGSASAVLASRAAASRPIADFDFLGVGDPVLRGPAATAAGLADLDPLPETRAELELSARPFKAAKLLTGSEASERRFRSQLLGSYRFLSFATHGLLRDEIEGVSEPALVLTATGAAGLADNGLLTASEIADLNLAARFVALSACNTANYDLDQAAAELPALASAFAIAGVPSTLATLWSVDSDTSRQVVAAVFAAVASGRGSAAALAEAQRAFLAAPPGRAYLHPRFWAPFVILGDGAALAEPGPGAGRVTAVELLTRAGGGGEVLALGRAQGRLAARYIGDPGEGGFRGAGVAVLGAGETVWRSENPGVGAASELLDLGQGLVAAGYVRGPEGRYVPTLEALDPSDGKLQVRWRGEPLAGLDTVIVGSARTAPGLGLLFVAGGDIAGGRRGAPQLEVQAVDRTISPRRLFAVDLPEGARRIDEATVTQVGRNLLLTYTERFSALTGLRMTEDEFDQPICASEPVTWIELREAGTGRLLQSREARGLVVRAAAEQGGAVVLAGSFKAVCEAEARATVLAVGAALELKPLYTDPSLGDSEARGIAVRPDGGYALAAGKQSVVDYRHEAGAADPFSLDDLKAPLSGMLVLLNAKGQVVSTRMLDSGFDLFVADAEAGPGEVMVGGSLGGDAAVFRLAVP